MAFRTQSRCPAGYLPLPPALGEAAVVAYTPPRHRHHRRRHQKLQHLGRCLHSCRPRLAWEEAVKGGRRRGRVLLQPATVMLLFLPRSSLHCKTCSSATRSEKMNNQEEECLLQSPLLLLKVPNLRHHHRRHRRRLVIGMPPLCSPLVATPRIPASAMS